MIREFKDHRLVVIDGNKCLNQATKKALLYSRRANLKFKNLKDFKNLVYHFFIVETLNLKKPLSLKFNCTIVFYAAEVKNQLKSEKMFENLVDLLKKTSPIPVFTMPYRNDKDLPLAAENCLAKHKTNLRTFSQHIFNNNLKALKNMYDTQIIIKGIDEEPRGNA